MRLLRVLALAALVASGAALGQTQPSGNHVFETSLHHTARGLSYWYSAKEGGLERLTGLPITDFTCLNCHVDSCETCHLKGTGTTSSYSRSQALLMTTCGKCHGFANVDATRQKGGILDVHFENGMTCMDCHTSAEVHGDGKVHNSLRDEGAMTARCEKCHAKLSAIPSHTVHEGKLACGACHLAEVPSCHNCHVETRLQAGKSVSIPMNNVVFLVNEAGQVRTAACLTFIYQNKTMVEFTPSFTHTIVKRGRACKDCHASPVVADIHSGKFVAGTYENDKFASLSGVVPVVDGMTWKFTFFDYNDGRWILNENAAPPLVHYSGYASPLTAEQFGKLQVAH